MRVAAVDATDVGVLQEAFRRSGMTAMEVARRIGWVRADDGRGDSSRVMRAIGLQPRKQRNGYQEQQTISKGRAVELIVAMDLDPADYELGVTGLVKECPICGAEMGVEDFPSRAHWRRNKTCGYRCAAFLRRHSEGGKPLYWTEGGIIDAIQKWAEKYGHPPARADWDITAALQAGSPERANRFLEDYWPAASTVVRRFGGWRAGLRAAGYEPRVAGDRPFNSPQLRKLTRRDLERLRRQGVHTAGPRHLAEAMKEVAKHEREDDLEMLQEALYELAAVAVAWADRVDK